jgi:Asp-tRNA(Asn)/Glu-tRNA(Gln) amidotransferase A subunit family amidase
MPDPLSLSARVAAREIAAGRLTAEALTVACLDRIAARETMVGAWHHLDPEAAMAAARRCDASPPSGPLHGIPIAVKDLIDTADMPTGYGSAIYDGHRPAADAACVSLARGAGAIVLGKTVTTEFACFTPGKTANPKTRPIRRGVHRAARPRRSPMAWCRWASEPRPQAR